MSERRIGPSAPRYVLALDQGTTSSRAIVFDADGRAIATAQRELPQIYPRPGWVEHDPQEILTGQVDCACRAVRMAGLTARDIAAIGIANQRETAIAWDRRTGKPATNAIVWQDRRTAGMCDELRREGDEADVRERTGLVIDAYFSATKFRWMLDHNANVQQLAREGHLCFGTVDSWLAFALTEREHHVTDVSNASRTLLFNLESGAWDDELCELFDIPPSALPKVVPTSGVIGEVRWPDELAGIPLAAMAGDQQAALFGQHAFEPGLAKNTYGTGCFMLMNLGSLPVISSSRLLTTVAWQLSPTAATGAGMQSQRSGSATGTSQPYPSAWSDLPTSFALEGSVFIGGAIVQWLRDELQIVRSADEIEALARSVSDNGGVYFVPAFAGLGAPHWDQNARGTITGLTRGTSAAHLARAALEGIAFQVADVLDAMQTDTSHPLKELRVDGGAAANDLLMQFQADILRLPVIRPKVTETTALGAGCLAGLAVGMWSSPEELKSHWEIERAFEPEMSDDEAEFRRGRWRSALDRARSWELEEAAARPAD
ncbi:MAG: glycerol kinase GlpK [Planctomycetota bacterium]